MELNSAVLLAILAVIVIALILERAIKLLIFIIAALVIAHILGIEIPGVEEIFDKLSLDSLNFDFSALSSLVDLFKSLLSVFGGV